MVKMYISITAIDSTGYKLINQKIYKQTSEYFYQNIRNKDLDPLISL